MQGDSFTITNWAWDQPKGKEQQDKFNRIGFTITGTVNGRERTFGPREDEETFTMLELIDFKWSNENLRDDLRCELVNSFSPLYNELNSQVFTCAVRFSEPSISLEKPDPVFYMFKETITRVTLDNLEILQPLDSDDFNVYVVDRRTKKWRSVQRRLPSEGVVCAKMYLDEIYQRKPCHMFMWQLVNERLLSSDAMKARVERDTGKHVFHMANPLDYVWFMSAELPGAKDLHNSLVADVMEIGCYSDTMTAEEIGNRIYDDLLSNRQSNSPKFFNKVLEMLGIFSSSSTAQKLEHPFFSKEEEHKTKSPELEILEKALELQFDLSEMGVSYVKNFSLDSKSAGMNLLNSIDKFKNKVEEFQNSLG